MSEKQLYEFAGKHVAMSNDEMVAAIRSTELKLRTGKFTYVETPLHNEQVADIKATWPARPKEHARKLLQTATPGSPVTVAIMRQVIIQTFRDMLAPDRAAITNLSADYEFKHLVAELALSTLFRKAPDASGSVSRAYLPDGKKYRIKVSSAPRKLVLNVDDIDSADFFVYAFYNAIAQNAWLVGYASKDDLRKETAICKKTHPEICTWEKPAYVLPLDRLRPMADIMAKASTTEFSSSIVMETTPSLSQLPVYADRTIQAMAKKGVEGFDLLADLGLRAPTVAAPAKSPAPAAPAVTKTDDILDI